MTWQLIHADCIDAMRELGEASVDAVVTDPPYGLEFMGKEWDRIGHSRGGRPRVEWNGTYPQTSPGWINATEAAQSQAWHQTWAAEALRVLKPGGHLLSFGGTRTIHRLICALEDAGFEIRDMLCWMFGSGFPKSHNLDGEWTGWGTALKPGWEGITLARKPLSGTVAANVLEYGTGALNVDGTRIEYDGERVQTEWPNRTTPNSPHPMGSDEVLREYDASKGRWPANVLLDADAAAALDEQSGPAGSWSTTPGSDGEGMFGARRGGATHDTRDSGGASRFFYTAKTSRAERENGVAQYGEAEERPLLWSSGEQSPGTFQADGTHRAARNNHPTVKPVDLMQWLCRLITPPKGLILDPFTGSGSTGIAALREGFSFIGIEREAEYVEIARARIIGDAPLFNAEEVTA